MLAFEWYMFVQAETSEQNKNEFSYNKLPSICDRTIGKKSITLIFKDA